MSDFPWSGFSPSVANDGVLTLFANDTACRFSSSADGGGRSMVRTIFPAVPGVTYKTTFSARVLQGEPGETAPGFGIDYPLAANLVDYFDYDQSGEWKEYTASFTVPYDADPNVDKVLFVYGVWTAKGGEIEVTRPIFSVDQVLDPSMVTREVVGGFGPLMAEGFGGIGITSFLADADAADIPTGFYKVTHSSFADPTSLASYAFDATLIHIRVDGQTDQHVRLSANLMLSRVDDGNGYTPWAVTHNSAADTGWIYPTLLNTWSDYGAGYSRVRYRKDAMGYVHIEGLARSGTEAGYGSTIFTLPAGFRPGGRVIALARVDEAETLENGNALVARLDLNAEGQVSLSSNGSSASSPISWASLSSVQPFVGT